MPFAGERLGGVRAEAKVLRERVRQGQPGQVLFRQRVQDGRVLGSLQDAVSGMPEAVPSEYRHDDDVHLRRRRNARSRRERGQLQLQQRSAELHQSHQVPVRLHVAGKFSFLDFMLINRSLSTDSHCRACGPWTFLQSYAC